jgi:micrococcal nuclease
VKILSAIILFISIQKTFAAIACNAERRHESYRSQNERLCAHDKTRLKCLEVREITDGDTLSVDISGVHPYFGEKASVRLYGLDTPESRPPTVECVELERGDSEIDREEYANCVEAKRLRKCEIDASKEATSLLAKAICEDSDRVDLEIAKDENGQLIREKYGRILGNIIILKKRGSRLTSVKAKDLLLNSRLAFEYDGGTKLTRDWCGKTLVQESKLQSSYVKENFCSSRKCTERTRQTRCFRRSTYSDQIACYSRRVEDNSGRWFQSCKAKSGAKRRSCFRTKAESYLEFCDLYKSSKDVKACRVDMGQAMGRYCSKLSGDMENDCEISVTR